MKYGDLIQFEPLFNLSQWQHKNLSQWQHKAIYNEALGRIEMHLVSHIAQTVNINDHTFSFIKGETIHTENSCKYTADEFIALAAKARFQADALWLDKDQLFSVHLFRVRAGDN